ncbi:MAG: hypothetical protein LBE35_09675 [Clostridiales bacterium]|nr:hypothetical protein [Clostridiales bacterium]
MNEGVFTILWRMITSSDVPFPTSETLTGSYVAPKAGEVYVISDIAATRYYNNPEFMGIEITASGSGGNTRTQICFGPEQEGRRIKLYVVFSNTVYEYEVQIWEAGCWTMNNPGSGPATPNAITFGDPVGIHDQWTENETDPTFPQPPPEYSPFIPNLLLDIDVPIGACMLNAAFKVTINPISTVNIITATVYRDGINTGVTLQQLIAGYTFTLQGFYVVDILYRYLGDGQNPPAPQDSVLIRDFTIDAEPFPHMQRESLIHSAVYPGEAVLFYHALSDDGSISYLDETGEFMLNFCGVYFVKWFVAPQTGLSTDGANFAICVNGSEDSPGAAHLKISAVSGVSIIKVDGPPPVMKLCNASDNSLQLSHVAKVTAGILIFRIGVDSQ